jgi:hypothetical protein
MGYRQPKLQKLSVQNTVDDERLFGGTHMDQGEVVAEKATSPMTMPRPT